MADDSRFVIMSEPVVGPDEVATKGFNTAFRGFDSGEVRAFLQRVAVNEKRLHFMDTGSRSRGQSRSMVILCCAT